MQSHRQKLAVENLAGSIRQSNFGWAACRSWEITGCPNLDSPSKVAIHDALPLRYVTVIHRGSPWNPESHRDNFAATRRNLRQIAATRRRLQQIAAKPGQRPGAELRTNCETHRKLHTESPAQPKPCGVAIIWTSSLHRPGWPAGTRQTKAG